MREEAARTASRSRRRPAAWSTASGGAAAARAPTIRGASKRSGAKPSTTAGRASASSTPSRPRCSTSRRAPSSRATTAPTSPSTSRSIRIAAASTAASTATRGPRTAFSGIRPGSTSRPSSTPRRTPPSCWSRSSPIRATSRACIALGTNTDPYQPIERERRITRSILEVLERTGHPVGIVTKSALVVRDIDILVAHGGARPGARWRSR